MGMLKRWSTGLKFKILLKESKQSCSKVTVVRVVSCLKSAMLSSFSGMLSNWVEIVSLMSLDIESLMQLCIAFEFWIALSFLRAIRAASILVSLMEWYLVELFFPATVSIPSGSTEFHFPSRARIQSKTTNDGNVETLPFYEVSKRELILLYADDSDWEERSKASSEENGSYTLGVTATGLSAVTAVAKACKAEAMAELLVSVTELLILLVCDLVLVRWSLKLLSSCRRLKILKYLMYYLCKKEIIWVAALVWLDYMCCLLLCRERLV